MNRNESKNKMKLRNCCFSAGSWGRAGVAAAIGVATLAASLLLWMGDQPAAAQARTAPPSAQMGETIPPPEGTPLYLPLLAAQPTPLAIPLPRLYGKVAVESGSLGWPASDSPDANLSVRGYSPTDAYLGLVNYNGDTDDQAPQMAAIFSPGRLPDFAGAYQVYDWDWNCNAPAGCRGNPLTYPYTVSLLELATTPGEPLSIAQRKQEIFTGGYIAMVLYAEEGRLTLTYTRNDTPAAGYMLHFEDVTVAPELVALYRQLDVEGRRELPALRNGETWGTAPNGSIKIAVRDRGSFLDPRACKDWWIDYRSQCVMRLWRPLPAPIRP